MTLQLYWKKVKRTICLAGYSGLLVFTLSGLMFQGRIWQLAGSLYWAVIVGSFLVQYIYNNHKERSKIEPKNLELLGKKIAVN